MTTTHGFSLTLGQPRDYSNSVAGAVDDDADRVEHWSSASSTPLDHGCRVHDDPGVVAVVAPPMI